MSQFNRAALERDEKFKHARLDLHRLEQAARKVIPTPRRAAQSDLTAMVLERGAKTTADAVDYLIWRMVRVPTAKPDA